MLCNAKPSSFFGGGGELKVSNFHPLLHTTLLNVMKFLMVIDFHF